MKKKKTSLWCICGLSNKNRCKGHHSSNYAIPNNNLSSGGNTEDIMDSGKQVTTKINSYFGNWKSFIQQNFYYKDHVSECQILTMMKGWWWILMILQRLKIKLISLLLSTRSVHELPYYFANCPTLLMLVNLPSCCLYRVRWIQMRCWLWHDRSYVSLLLCSLCTYYVHQLQ